MTNNEFNATLLLLNYFYSEKYSATFSTYTFKNKHEEIGIKVMYKIIEVLQSIYVEDEFSHFSGLCTCSNYEETIDYITALDLDNLPPNGRIKND